MVAGGRGGAGPGGGRRRARAGPGATTTGSEGARLAAHTSALRAAGFAEVGTLWQRGSSRVLAAVVR